MCCFSTQLEFNGWARLTIRPQAYIPTRTLFKVLKKDPIQILDLIYKRTLYPLHGKLILGLK